MDTNPKSPAAAKERKEHKEHMSFSLIAGADDEIQAVNICAQAIEQLCGDDSGAKERIVVYLGSRYGGGQG